MLRVHQTEFHADGNALQACVASLFGLRLDDVPNFVATSDYWVSMLKFAKQQGLSLIKVPLGEDGTLPYPSTPGTLCLARGYSHRGKNHVVVAAVANDGVSLLKIHDPYPSGACVAHTTHGGFLAGPATWAGFYVSVKSPTVIHSVTADTGLEDAADGSASLSSLPLPSPPPPPPIHSSASTSSLSCPSIHSATPSLLGPIRSQTARAAAARRWRQLLHLCDAAEQAAA